MIIIILLLICCFLLAYKYLNEYNIKYINQQKEQLQCKYVSSHGILLSCLIRSSIPISSIPILIFYNFEKLQNNCSIYVATSALSEFIKKINNININFYLVTGDADQSCPTDVLSDDEFINFINNDKIIGWYAQNCVREHPKLYKMPIGLDYHSKISGLKLRPIENERMMIEYKTKSKPFYEREIKCYVNFMFGNKFHKLKFGYDRKDALNNIPKDLIFAEKSRVNRDVSFENQIKYAFVVSPHGNGLDCHRTWEALCLGCIPIVKTSPIDSLFDDLPVLIVNNWNDVNIDLLNKTIDEFKNKQFNYDKLLLKYWTDKFNKF
jgi:hypothetical protein